MDAVVFCSLFPLALSYETPSSVSGITLFHQEVDPVAINFDDDEDGSSGREYEVRML